MSTTTPQTAKAHAIEKTRWRIDPTRSSVEFRTPTFWGLVTVKGRFERYDGTLDLRRQPAVDLTIEAASLDTKNKMRDKHLRSADFFDVENHPQVRFVSDSATARRRAADGPRPSSTRREEHARSTSTPACGVSAMSWKWTPVRYADHRELGMSHSPLGMIRTPSELIVHGRLSADDRSART